MRKRQTPAAPRPKPKWRVSSEELRLAQQNGEELAAAKTAAEAETTRMNEELNAAQVEMQHVMAALQESEAERQAGREAKAQLIAAGKGAGRPHSNRSPS